MMITVRFSDGPDVEVRMRCDCSDVCDEMLLLWTVQLSGDRSEHKMRVLADWQAFDVSDCNGLILDGGEPQVTRDGNAVTYVYRCV